jgi:hypothetical protein
MEMKQNISQKMMGMDIAMQQLMAFDYEMTITSVGKNEIQAQMTFKNITYMVDSPYMKMEYDTKNPKQDANEIDRFMTKMLNAVIGKTMEVKMQPDGTVTSISGMDAIAQAMAQAAGTENGQIAAQIGATLTQQIDDKMLKSTLEQSFKIYPSKPISKDESWDVPLSLNMGGAAASVKTKYKLKDVKNKKAYIDMSSVIEMQPGNGTKLSGTMTGSMVMDTATGMPESSEVAQDFDGTISVNGAEMPMKIQSTVKYTIKKTK